MRDPLPTTLATRRLSPPRYPVAIALLLTAAACASSSTQHPDTCNVRIVTVTPDGATLGVGQTVTLHAAYTAGISAACIPGVPASSLRWGSTDAATVSIDSLAGTAVAHRAGTASVTLHVPGSNTSLGGTQVTVTP